MSHQLMTGLGIILGLFIIGEIPAFEQNFLIPATINHPHLVVLAEAILGAVAVWVAGRNKPVEVKR